MQIRDLWVSFRRVTHSTKKQKKGFHNTVWFTKLNFMQER